MSKTITKDFIIETRKHIFVELDQEHIDWINGLIAEGLSHIKINGEPIRPLTDSEMQTILKGNQFGNYIQEDYFNSEVPNTNGYKVLYYVLQDFLQDLLWSLEDSVYCDVLSDDVTYDNIEVEDDEENEPTYRC